MRIARRFRGPPDSGNGGYVAGMLARELGSSNVLVTLHHPPPLERDLDLGGDGVTAWLKDGEAVIATAEKHMLAIETSSPPSLSEAEVAESGYTGFRTHAFPGCFVCGPERSPGDGLRTFAGASGAGQVAAVWHPDESLLDSSGAVRPQFVWAALDCPGYWAVAAKAGIAVLGRFAAIIHADPFPCEPHVVTGWPIRSDGRKHLAGTAIYDGRGQLLAAAEATWITLKG